MRKNDNFCTNLKLYHISSCFTTLTFFPFCLAFSTLNRNSLHIILKLSLGCGDNWHKCSYQKTGGNKMKKMLALLLVVMMILSMAACGSKNAAGNTETKAPAGNAPAASGEKGYH